jgi:protein transport protein SEC24
VFGFDLSSPEANDPTRLQVEPERPGSPLSARLCAVLRALRAGRPTYAQCFVVRQGSPMEMHIQQYWVEDRGANTQGYPDWMMAVYKGVMAK